MVGWRVRPVVGWRVRPVVLAGPQAPVCCQPCPDSSVLEDKSWRVLLGYLGLSRPPSDLTILMEHSYVNTLEAPQKTLHVSDFRELNYFFSWKT